MQRIPLTLLCLAMLSACVWGAFASAPIAVAPLIWLGALWLPGAALALSPSVPSRDRLDAIWLPAALGPVIFGAGICLARLAGLSLSVGAVTTVVAGGVALLARFWIPATPPTADTHDSGKEPDARGWVFPLILGGAVFALGAIPPLANAPIREDGDALLHLPVIQRVLAGSFPPDNPFLAGEPLAYFWFYHVTLAGIARLSGIPLDLVPALFNVQALLILLLALDRAGRRFGLSPLARGIALALVGLGFSPWGWMRLLYLQATHPEINWALFRAWGVSALLPALNPADPRLAGSLTKVAVTNALPMSLALAAVAGGCPVRRRMSAWIRHGIFVAGCLAFHVVTGLLLATGLLVRWVLVKPRAEHGGEHSRAALASLAAGILVALPYLIAVLQARSGSGATTIEPQIGRAFDLYLALAGVVLLALPMLPAWFRADDPRSWLTTAIPALGLPFFVHLTDGNEYKSVFFLLVFLSLPAGAGAARLARGRPVLALMILLPFVPTALLVARGYAVWTPPGTMRPDDRALAVQVGRDLPIDAILWKPDPGNPYDRLTLPVARPVYLSDTYALQIMGQWDGEEARWRRGSLALAGVAQRTPEALAAARARLGSEHPLFALVTAAAQRRHPHLTTVFEQLDMPRVASNRLFAVYAFPSARGRDAPSARK